MPTITIKNIPEELYARLKASAAAHRRSINSEVIVCIEQAVSSQRIEPQAMLDRARELREMTAGYRITDGEFAETKAAGRP